MAEASYQNYSRAAENNQEPILTRLGELLTSAVTSPTTSSMTVLEIGSGSGQHIVHFARAHGRITWQPSDQGVYFEGLKNNIERLAPENVLAPVYLDLEDESWPVGKVDLVYAANVVHIMPERLLPSLFSGAAGTIVKGGLLCIYGPFKYDAGFTTESNEHFDGWLKERDPLSGIRDFEVLLELGSGHGFKLNHDFNMPANNQFLVFEQTIQKGPA